MEGFSASESGWSVNSHRRQAHSHSHPNRGLSLCVGEGLHRLVRLIRDLAVRSQFAESSSQRLTSQCAAGNAMSSGELLLNVVGLSKRFGGLAASDNVSLSVYKGEIHAVIGPNGAGKTTLIAQLQG